MSTSFKCFLLSLPLCTGAMGAPPTKLQIEVEFPFSNRSNYGRGTAIGGHQWYAYLRPGHYSEGYRGNLGDPLLLRWPNLNQSFNDRVEGIQHLLKEGWYAPKTIPVCYKDGEKTIEDPHPRCLDEVIYESPLIIGAVLYTDKSPDGCHIGVAERTGTPPCHSDNKSLNEAIRAKFSNFIQSNYRQE